MQEMRVYLLNNTKPYHDEDDGYSGDWFNCPVDFEEVKEKLGVEHEEQIEIADYELPFDLHSDTPLWEINANCRMVLELEGTPIGNEMKAIQQKWFSNFEEFIDHKDEIRYYDVGDGAALAEYLICEENVFGEIPHELQKHMAKKALTKLFNTIMMRAGITLIITTAFSISTMFYSISSGYPFFMVAFLQIVTFAGMVL